MNTVLLTGFEPFGGDARNPSQDIAQRLDGAVIGRHRVVGVVLPCVFGRSLRLLQRHVTALRPKLVLALGVASGRAAITPERVAINIDDARIPDNAGQQPVDVPIVRRGPAAYWSTLPIKAIVAALRAQGIPAEVSQTAGTFVCNHVFYGLMHRLRHGRPGATRGGFIHVPALPEQAPAGQPSLPLETMLAAIEIAIVVSLRTVHDQRIAGGAVN